MSSVVISGDSSGSVTLTVPSAAGSNTITMPASTGTAALTSDVIGVNQTWQNMTSSRAFGTTYTNSTGKPIALSIFATGATPNLTVGSTIFIGASASGTAFTIVPNGGTYSATSGTLNTWYELR
jgi:hypothetical protein